MGMDIHEIFTWPSRERNILPSMQEVGPIQDTWYKKINVEFKVLKIRSDIEPDKALI